jgi:hypothetical protein
VKNLEWDSLLIQPFPDPEVRATDTVLLQMGAVPLVMLRNREEGSALILNFDPEAGNAMRHAGLALLLHRYLLQVQRRLEVPEAVNLLTGQAVDLPQAVYTFQPVSEAGALELSPGGQLPDQAGWLRGIRGDELLVSIACVYGDVEEGDFREAAAQDLPKDLLLASRRRHEEADLWLPLWMSLLGLTVVGTWWAGAERRGSS